MKIKILGTGCANCHKLLENTKKAIEEEKLKDIEIEHIQEIEKIIEYGVMSNPSIIIDEEIKASGKIPKVEEIRSWLK